MAVETVLDARVGNDVVFAGPGGDTIHLIAGDVQPGGLETIDCGTGSDTLVLTGLTAQDLIGVTPDITIDFLTFFKSDDRLLPVLPARRSLASETLDFAVHDGGVHGTHVHVERFLHR